MRERCFSCGTPMINGVCPECGYQYPFAFKCPYSKDVVCQISKKLCNKTYQYEKCKLWQQQW